MPKSSLPEFRFRRLLLQAVLVPTALMALVVGAAFDLVENLRPTIGYSLLAASSLVTAWVVFRYLTALARRYGQALDTSERHAAELKASEERLGGIISSAMDAIISINTEQKIILFNQAAENMFGVPAAAALGQPLERFIPTRYRAQHHQHVVHFGQTGTTSRSMGALGKLTALRADGTEFPIEAAISHVTSAGQKIYTVILRDITARRRSEVELQEAKDAAESANHSKDQFLAMLSHELRTPLTPVLSMVSSLESSSQLNEDLRADLALVRRNVELEARLIDDMLDLTRISKGKLRLHWEVVDVHSILQHTLHICRPDIAAKHLRMATDLAAARYHVRGDPARLQQVCWNLLKNAVKFTPNGGTITLRTANPAFGVPPLGGVEEGEVRSSRFSVREGGEHASGPSAPSVDKSEDGPIQNSEFNIQNSISIQISDTGIGITPEVLPRIFNAFEQGEQTITRQFGGLGLGLAISRMLVEAHHGQIAAQSEGRGQGATFSVSLPTVPAPLPRSADQPEPPPSPRQPLRVLLVEDHEDTLRVMTRLLQSIGYHVAGAGSVAAALAQAQRQRFDIVVSDIGLPDGTGLDLMRQLRLLYPAPGIALSGYGMEADIAKSRDAGFVEHLTKPIDLHALDQAIQQVAAQFISHSPTPPI